MVTITSHVSTNIFQVEHISAVKFPMGYETKYKHSSDIKISKTLKKSEKNCKSTFKGIESVYPVMLLNCNALCH